MEIARAGIHPAPRSGSGDKINALLFDVECCLVGDATLQDVLSGARKLLILAFIICVQEKYSAMIISSNCREKKEGTLWNTNMTKVKGQRVKSIGMET